ncbi:predicted protein [Naegleria gruberi]|uniref:Predicted protein n=1 Tax=Naegleria gruberi TaxID=5762 RepID=D2V2F4_NAEGR|nr:uncharacterized protein NAEGRDRAFT_62982 [Naegleria gruberi]EFC49048.1 predicted protein [Naegleria gruberi]|eukprot:XP_002681792.1 predicted protein [Naegleria gruberi strain NEG-M]
MSSQQLITEEGFDLHDPPTDGISSLNFSTLNHDLLLVTSWDKSVRIYNVKSNSLVTKYEHQTSVLCGCFSNGEECTFSAGLDGKLVKYNMKSGEQSVIGTFPDFHKSAIKCISTIPGTPEKIITGSWDGTIKLWDTQQNTCIQTLDLTKKVYSMDVTPDGSKLVVASQDLLIFIVHIQKDSNQPLSLHIRKQSGLKYQTRVVKCFGDNNSYAIGSIEGRVAVEYFNNSNSNYAFKCHRSQTGQQAVETLYPVNTIDFNPRHPNIFVTGGCDGVLMFWDKDKKRRVSRSAPYSTSIAVLTFSTSGEYLACAVSYTWEMGNKSHPSDRIIVKKVYS